MSNRPIDLGSSRLGLSDVVRVLSLEAMALRVTAAMNRATIDVLLLKGPVTNEWLYADPLARGYRDIDLLVAPESQHAAEAVLTELGFHNDHARVLGVYRPDYETSWTSDGGSIDLHTRLAGVPFSQAGSAWARMYADAAVFRLHGREVRTIGLAARTMLLGLHLARSRDDAQVRLDLETALSMLSDESWRAAADLADELGAAACFDVGMRRISAGRALLERLRFAADPTVESLLVDQQAPQEAIVIAASLQSSRREFAALAARWFRTETAQRPPLRDVLAALARFPSALFLVLRMQRQVRRTVRLESRNGHNPTAH